MKSFRFSLLFIAGGILMFGQADPPTRVGRIGYMSGSVSFQPAGVEDWVPASPNRPVTTGDQIWVDDGGRAEMHVGATALRLGSQTAFEFLNLDDRTAQIQLSSGSLSVHVQYLEPNEIFEVDTPNLAFSIYRLGDYRIDVLPDSQTTLVTVRVGTGDVTGGGQAFSLNQGQQASVTGDQSIEYNVYTAPAPDWWDTWCLDREIREEHSPSLRYVHADMTGYVDLDDHGDWQDSPYGEVWTPRDVPAGWAPYHYGHWAWIDPWGWTWVDDASWGFAPFHYGRWAYWRNNWVWVPGPMSETPVYAPALVAWVGGEHFGVSLSLGDAAVAWVPLGPREVYMPPYRVSPAYATRINTSNTVVTNINVTNIYNTTNITTVNYVNARAPNAVVAVSAQAMGTAQSVHEVSRPVSAAALSSSQVMRTAQVAPQRQAVLGRSAGPANVPHPPAAVTGRAVVARTPPPPPPVPFARRQQALQANPGVPLNPQQVQQIRQSSPPPARPVVVRQAPPAAQVVQPRVAPGPPARSAVPGRQGMQPGNGNQTPAAPVQEYKPVAQPPYRPAPPPQTQSQPKPVQPAYRPPQPQETTPSAPAKRPEYRPAPPQPQETTPSAPAKQPEYRPAPPQPQETTPSAPAKRPEYRPAPPQPQETTPSAPAKRPEYRPAPPQPQETTPSAPAKQPEYRPAPPPQAAPPMTSHPPVAAPPPPGNTKSAPTKDQKKGTDKKPKETREER